MKITITFYFWIQIQFQRTLPVREYVKQVYNIIKNVKYMMKQQRTDEEKSSFGFDCIKARRIPNDSEWFWKVNTTYIYLIAIHLFYPFHCIHCFRRQTNLIWLHIFQWNIFFTHPYILSKVTIWNRRYPISQQQKKGIPKSNLLKLPFNTIVIKRKLWQKYPHFSVDSRQILFV